jgi:two-component system cell cycle response regulator
MNAPTTGSATTTTDLVPIADRLRSMQYFRFVIAAVAAIVALGGGTGLEVHRNTIWAVTAIYIAISVTSHLVWRFSRQGGLAVFGFVLILDGLFLAWASYATGGWASPLRFMVVLHVIAVALLASYRTGVKVAVWHSLLLLVVFYARQGGLLHHESGAGVVGTPFQQLVGFSAVLWFAAIATSHFSAVNERELRRRRYDMEALAGMAKDLELTRGSSATAGVLLASTVDTFEVERGLVLGALDGGDGLTVLAANGPIGPLPEPEAPGETSVIADVMINRRTRLVGGLDPRQDPLLNSLLPDARNLVVVPLSSEGHSIGVLVVERQLKGSRIERRIVSMLERFAAHGALSLRNAWLLEQVQRIAASDALTGLANRGTLQEALGRDLARALRESGTLSLLMLDVDHFKAVNDHFGHQAGDVVLQRVASRLDEASRAGDLPGRYGGEEFAVLLPDTDVADALMVAERLRAAVANDSEAPVVTVSVGVATFPNDAVDADGLVRAADAALYASKRAGRDRVTSASEAPEDAQEAA